MIAASAEHSNQTIESLFPFNGWQGFPGTVCAKHAATTWARSLVPGGQCRQAGAPQPGRRAQERSGMPSDRPGFRRSAEA
eukprot:6081171-Pyramimonas_sp.AAC.1